MDSGFWTSRLAAAKRQYTLQHHHHHQNRLSIDDFEVEDEVRPDFPCPYCYDDFDVASLCSHLEDEHSCESKVTASVLFYIALGMFYLLCQSHKGQLKSYYSATWTPIQEKHCRLHRVAIPSSQALSLLGRDLREAHLRVLLGGGGYWSNNANLSNAATDPFLSSLVLNFPSSDIEEISKSVVTSAEDTAAKNPAPTHIWKSSFDPSLSQEERDKRMRQAAGRAGFVQDLVLTTL